MSMETIEVKPADLRIGDKLVQYEGDEVTGTPGRLNSHKITVQTTAGAYSFPDDRVLVVERGEACPMTGRSASVCDPPDHRGCPDLRPPSEWVKNRRIVP